MCIRDSMPLRQSYRDGLKSLLADMKNTCRQELLGESRRTLTYRGVTYTK